MVLRSCLALAALPLGLSFLCCAANAEDSGAIPAYVKASLEDAGRPPWEIARDADRNPAAVMIFAGIKPGQVVVDLFPQAGYYTRIISQIVGRKGRVYSFVPFADIRDRATRNGPSVLDPGQNEPLTRIQLAYAIEETPAYINTHVIWEQVTQYGALFALPEQVDAVFTANHYHVFHTKDFASADMVAVNKAIFRALKPGGVYVVVDNAAKPGTGFSEAETLGRNDIEAVKKEILAAGFTLDGASDAAAFAGDDHSKSADGATAPVDEFALRFKKPLTATGDKRPPHGSMDGYYGNTDISNIGAMGKVTGERERRVFYHPDGRYEEFGPPNTGNNPWQMGLWYWDADGHNCQLHQWPQDARGRIVCHSTQTGVTIGSTWTNDTNGMAGRHPVPHTIVKGYAHYNVPD